LTCLPVILNADASNVRSMPLRETTPDLPIGATVAQIRDALFDLPNIGSQGVEVTFGANVGSLRYLSLLHEAAAASVPGQSFKLLFLIDFINVTLQSAFPSLYSAAVTPGVCG
jgi:hypothetical protein